MAWFSLLAGLALVVGCVAFVLRLERPMTISIRGVDGTTRVEYRRARPQEKTVLRVIAFFVGMFGACVVADAVPSFDRALPEEWVRQLLGAGAFVTVTSAFAWTAWRRIGGLLDTASPPVPRDPVPEADVATGGDDNEIEVGGDDVDEAVVTYLGQLAWSNAAGALVLAIASTAMAVYGIIQFGRVWQGETFHLPGVLAWLQPVSAFGSWIGLGDVPLRIILLSVGILVSLFRGKTGGVLTVAILALYGLVAVVLWPFGYQGAWLNVGHRVLTWP